MRYQATRISHHACLAIWGGNNEVEQVPAASPPSLPSQAVMAMPCVLCTDAAGLMQGLRVAAVSLLSWRLDNCCSLDD